MSTRERGQRTLGRGGLPRTYELSIPEQPQPLIATLDCPERLLVAWHRQATGFFNLLDENGHYHGSPPQAEFWEVREYRRVDHVEGYSATYERVPR